MRAPDPDAGTSTQWGQFPWVVLASASPRRHRLLASILAEFEVVDPGPDPPVEIVEPRLRALALARAKAEAGAVLRPGRRVLAADTLVACAGRILDKPGSRREAEESLRLLEGREHEVWTAVCLRLADGVRLEAVDCAVVRFRALPEADLASWLDSGRWRDKAGAYAIQDLPGGWAEILQGDRETIVGLRTATVRRLLSAASPCPQEPKR